MIPCLCCLATVSASLGLARVTIILELSHVVVIDAQPIQFPDNKFITGGKSLEALVQLTAFYSYPYFLPYSPLSYRLTPSSSPLQPIFPERAAVENTPVFPY